MSYTKTTWASGDVVSSEKLNHIEQGVYDASNGTLIINVTPDAEANDGSCTADKTLAEILDAYNNGKLPITVFYTNPTAPLILTPKVIAEMTGVGASAIFNITMFGELNGEYVIETYAVTFVNTGSDDTVAFGHVIKTLA